MRAELLKLLVAPGVVATIGAMAGAGLIMPVIGGVPQLSRFAAVVEGGGEGVHPAFRLAALAVSVGEDALRLRARLRLSNEEFDRIERIARALEGLGGRADLPGIAALRHLAHDAGNDAVAAALVLLKASAGGEDRDCVQQLIAELGRTPSFLLTGKDVVARGIAPGPRVGQALEAARRGWIEAGCPASAEVQFALLDAVVGQARP